MMCTWILTHFDRLLLINNCGPVHIQKLRQSKQIKYIKFSLECVHGPTLAKS